LGDVKCDRVHEQNSATKQIKHALPTSTIDLDYKLSVWNIDLCGLW